MEMPTILGEHLRYCGGVETEDQLLEQLVAKPRDLVDFFEFATDDETWSATHSHFISAVLKWFTEQHLQDNMIHEYGERIVRKIQQHKHKLSPYISLNINFNLDNRTVPANSMVFGIMSPFFQDLIRKECRDKKSNVLKLSGVPFDVFHQIEEYITTGEAQDLWRGEQDLLMDILKQSTEWEVTDLGVLCEDILKRYITITNVIELLLLSHEERWEHLRTSTFEFINQEQVGVKLEPCSIDDLKFTFYDFKERAMRVFNQVKQAVTHIGYTLDLTEQGEFSDTLVDCPNLIGLDISRTRIFNERLYHIPSYLEELDLSKNPWLDDRNLAEMVKICPNVNRLCLNGNSQLGYTGWTELNKLKRLEHLDISRCYQIGDRDLKLIMRACPEVTDLSLEECTNISETMFFEFGKHADNIQDLNISRTKIDNTSLIELLTRSPRLGYVNVTHCENLTDKGVLEAIRHAPALHTINISKCNLSSDVIKQMLKIRSFITVVS